MDRPNEAGLQLLTDGAENFVGVLPNVVMGIVQKLHSNCAPQNRTR